MVDDDETNRTVAEMMLDATGLQVDTAEDGRVAIEMATRTPYDLIFMDMQMPTMDGLTATRKLRQQQRSRKTPIIAMTANAFVADRKRCQEAGMDDFLSKPFDPEALYAITLKWLAVGEVAA